MSFSDSVAKVLLCLFIILLTKPIKAELDDYLPKDPGPTSSNYGDTGLLEIPSARLMPEGSFKIGINSFNPYEVTAMTATPFSWLEATFRYTELENQLYSPFPSFSGNQSLKDKAFDFKFRLFEETNRFPSVVIGLRDVGGTGLFASEYLAASKQFGPLDLTAGLGWGHLGRTGELNNPLVSIHDSFKERGGYEGEGGTFNYRSWFSGEEIGLFGGLEYRFKRLGTRLKIEYDTSDQSQAVSPLIPIRVSSRVNFGLSFPAGQWGEYSIGYQRGNTFQFSFFLKSNFSKKNLVPKFDPPPPLARLNRSQKEKLKTDKNFFYRSLLTNMNKYEVYLQAATREANKLEITFSQNKYRSYSRATGRAARVAASLSPEEIEIVEIYHLNANSEVAKISLNREHFLKAVEKEISPQELFLSSEMDSAYPRHMDRAEFRPKPKLPDVSWKMAPALRTHIGGPEAFFLGQVWWRTDIVALLARGLTLYTTLGINIYDNFDQFNNPSYSNLPHVRSDIQEYLSEGRTNIARMKLDYIWSPLKDVYARLDLGLIEEMYGGVGGEILYRPYKSKYALGLVAHRVKKRGFKQRFSFRDYTVNTGFFQFYYDWPGEVTSQVLLGKYLAGDKGMTLDLSKRFKTGFRLGIFATKTNVSTELFGEGSFDKGFYFEVPTDIFLTTFQPGSISMGLHPLTKDGGAPLLNHNALIGLVSGSEYYGIERDWNDILD